MEIVNYWAVLASAVASMVIGSIWYGPLFGKLFMRETGMDKMSKEKMAAAKKTMWVSYLAQFIASLVMFYGVAVLVSSFNQMSLRGGIITGFLVWLGFVVPVKIGDVAWGGKMSLFWLNIGNMLITLLAVGAIIGAW